MWWRTWLHYFPIIVWYWSLHPWNNAATYKLTENDCIESWFDFKLFDWEMSQVAHVSFLFWVPIQYLRDLCCNDTPVLFSLAQCFHFFHEILSVFYFPLHWKQWNVFSWIYSAWNGFTCQEKNTWCNTLLTFIKSVNTLLFIVIFFHLPLYLFDIRRGKILTVGHPVDKPLLVFFIKATWIIRS